MEASADQMTAEGAAAFNADVVDPPEVPHFSVAGVSGMSDGGYHCKGGSLFDIDRVDVLDPLLTATWTAIGDGLLNPRANDGIVPTDSMRWGTFLGCVPADHFDQIGQIADLAPNLVSGFDHIKFFKKLVTFVRSVEEDG